ncbi:MAG: BamA/TamA family outer membrane protein [Bacteroidetes bacterium]|nr:BamA/TamA family outer membrane protein [Bacteroidota bacterium]
MRLAILCLILLFRFTPMVRSQGAIISHDSIVFVEKTLKKINKNVSFTVVPGPIFGSTQKVGFAVLPMIVYNLKKSDTITPPSSTAVMFYFDFYGSWMTGVKQSLYWNHNKWRAFLTFNVGEMQLKFFGIGRDTVIIDNNDANYVWTTQKEMSVTLTCFRKIYKGLYGGLEYNYSLSNLQGTDSVSTAELTRSELPLGQTYESVLIPTIVWDNRDNIFWSSKGYYATFSCQLSESIVLNTRGYNIFNVSVNGYHRLRKDSKNLILAWHFYSQAAWGDLPYNMFANYGHGDAAAGYTGGKYVNHSEATAQVELRAEIWKFIALGGYAGTGKIFPSFDVFGQSVWLNFLGANLYLNIIPSQNIRLRLGAAISRKDYGLYIGIGQAF